MIFFFRCLEWTVNIKAVIHPDLLDFDLLPSSLQKEQQGAWKELQLSSGMKD